MPRTFYEYDDDGRLVSSWTESEWDDESVAEILAIDYISRNTGQDGEWLPDALNPAADPQEYGSGFLFVPEGPFTNWYRKAIDDRLEAWKKEQGEKANLNGVFFTAKRVDYDVPTD